MKFIHTFAALGSAVILSAHAAEPVSLTTEEVVVTATRFKEARSDLPIGVTVISERQIRRSTASTLPELLMQQPGIRVRDLSGSPNLQVDMRGFGIFGDQNTLVLLDGQRISENEQAAVNWSAVPLSAIERIEIVRGSGAVLYGGGATGGTINIITKAPEPKRRTAGVAAGFGSYGTSDGRASLNLAGESLGMIVDASQLETDNYRANNRLRQKNLQTDVRYVGERGSLALKLGAHDQDLQLPGSLSEAQLQADRRAAATPFDFSSLSGGHLNLGAELRVGPGELAVNAGYRDKHATASFFVGTPFQNNIDTRVRVWNFAPRLKVPYAVGGVVNSLIVGMDWDDWNFDSTAGPAVPGRPLALQRNFAGYLQNIASLSPATTLSAGVRFHGTNYAVRDALNPAAADSRRRNLRAYELAARHKLGESAALYAKLGSSFRIPNVNDVYNLFTATVTMLEPQTSHDRELGVEFQGATARYRAAFYHMDINNEIHLDPVAFNNVNLPPTRRYGLELEGAWQVTGGLSAFANYTHAISRFREGSFGGVNVAGKEVPLVPRHAFNLGAGWEFAPRTRLDAVVNYVGPQVFDSDETNAFGRKMPAYTVVDVRLARDTGRWLLTAAVKNLFNEKYFTYGTFTGFPTFAALPAPERSLFFGARYMLK